jgi:hypothetical protein
MQPDAPPSTGEFTSPAPGALVVLTGEQGGARRPLAAPLTLLGRAAGCEVRLTADGVRDLHAAVVHGPDGFSLRDLAGEGVTINGEAVAARRLKDGDEVAVGPCRFRVEVAPAAAAPERDALRAQAAAVAAQQAALAEEEARLAQRRTALERQEEQLAAHLEERRRRLVASQEQNRQEREALQAERAAAAQELAETRRRLGEALADAAAADKQARAERVRLVELRRRMRCRWRRHWRAHENELHRRAGEVVSGQNRLQKEANALRREREALAEARKHFNGEVELGKRALRAQWEELSLAQQQWEACLNREQDERNRRARSLEARSAAVAKAESSWAARERQARRAHDALLREIDGLEARARNQRRRLEDEYQAAPPAGREGFAADVPPVVAPPGLLPAPVPEPDGATAAQADALQRVADLLADQRLHLLEQWRGLLELQEAWRQEHEAALAHLEAAGRRLAERERGVAALERAAQSTAAESRQRQQSLAQLRLSLEGWQARLTAREAAWEGERDALLAEVRAREEAAESFSRRVQDLSRRRTVLRRKEAEELAAARARCEDLRRQYASLWQECQQRRNALAQEQRDLAARTLALERLRLEQLGRVPDAAKAERRLDRLRRRSYARLTASGRKLDAERSSLGAEGARLEAYFAELQRLGADLAAGREELTRERTTWEDGRAAAEEADRRRGLELRRMQAHREQDAQELTRLREEVERVARLLIDDYEEAAPPATQAA